MPDVLRRPPGPVLRWFLRAPRVLYSLGLGWVLGRRFVQVVHTGRRSGMRRTTVLEVVTHDEASITVAAAWGPTSDWFRNVVANPAVRVSSGRLRDVEAAAHVLDEDEAAEVFDRYRRQHPKAAAGLAKAVGLPIDDIDRMATTIPAVRFVLED